MKTKNKRQKTMKNNFFKKGDFTLNKIAIIILALVALLWFIFFENSLKDAAIRTVDNLANFLRFG